MRLQIVKSKNAASLYVVKSIFENGKRTSKVVEKLGTYANLLETLDGQDPIEWAKKYIEELNKKEQRRKTGGTGKILSCKTNHKERTAFLQRRLFISAANISCSWFTQNLQDNY